MVTIIDNRINKKWNINDIESGTLIAYTIDSLPIIAYTIDSLPKIYYGIIIKDIDNNNPILYDIKDGVYYDDMFKEDYMNDYDIVDVLDAKIVIE